MSSTTCPKCGFRQDEADECRRCGLIFRKYRGELPALDIPAPQHEPAVATRSPGRRLFRILRWAPLLVSATMLALLLRPSSPPLIQTTPEAAGESQVKVEQFQRAVRAGAPATLQLDEAELNVWMQSNLALQRPPSASSIARSVMAGQKLPVAEQAGSTVRDVRIHLDGEKLAAWVIFDVHGLDVTFQLEGSVSAADGFLRLKPTGGKIGSLPLSGSLLDKAVSRLFDSPENREKFRLPPQITDIRVENSELVVTSR